MRLRIEIAGATYHVIARGVDRRRIFSDDEDYETYTRLLGAVVKRQGWRLLAYCLMPNHVHLVLETPTTNLANGMQWLHGRYARLFNRRHKRRGHLFEARYLSPLVADDQLPRTVAYVAMNPVKAALCRTSDEWEWSSHPARHRKRAWIAHEHLEDRLEALIGERCYDALVRAWQVAHEAVVEARRSAPNLRVIRPDELPEPALSKTAHRPRDVL